MIWFYKSFYQSNSEMSKTIATDSNWISIKFLINSFNKTNKKTIAKKMILFYKSFYLTYSNIIIPLHI